MSNTSGEDNLSQFMDLARKASQKTRGINDQSLRMMANLAARLQLSAEEMEAAGAQLGLNNSEVQQVIADGNLGSEMGGGSALRSVLIFGCLALLLGAGGGAAFFVLNQNANNNPPPQQVAQNHDTGKQTTKPAETGTGKTPSNTNNSNNGGKPKNGGDAGPGNPPPAGPKMFPDFELFTPVARLQAQLPAEVVTLEQLKSPDPGKRADAWKQLLPKLPELMGQKDNLKSLLVSYHAKELADGNAQLIREQILKLLPPQVPTVPDKASVYDNAFWAADLAVDALQHPALPAARKEKLRQELEAALQTKLIADQTTAQLKRQCGKALSELFYGELIKAAKKEPEKSEKLELSLAPQALAHLGLNQGELSGKLKQAINEAKAPAAPPKPDPMPKTPPTPDPSPKPVDPKPKPVDPPPKPIDPPAPVVDARLDKLTNTASVLLKKTQPGVSDPVKVLQDSVNLAYTTTLAVALANKKQAKFDELAASAPNLNEYVAKVKPPEQPKPPPPPPPKPDDDPPANPMVPPPNPGGFPPPGFQGGPPGIGFMGGPKPVPGGGFPGVPGGGFPGGPAFMGGPNPFPGGGFPGGAGVVGLPEGGFPGGMAGIVGIPPGGMAGVVGIPPGGLGGEFAGNQGGGVLGMPNPPPMGGPTFTPAEELAVAIKLIKSNLPIGRYKALEYVSQVCKEPDLQSHEAEAVAVYLLAGTPAKEFEAGVPLLPGLSRFKAVHLALADLCGDSVVTAPRLEIIVSAVTGKQANLVKDGDWRKQAKVLLLQKALTMSADGAPEGDAVQLLLRDLYHKQADLMGLEIPASVTKTSAILERLIDHVADQLAKKPDATDGTKKFLKSLPGQLAAAHYLAGGNDIQQTVLLQRLWLDLLAEKLALEQPTKAQQARDLCLELDAKCRTQTSALAQMWLCDQYLLRVWLLHLDQPPPAAKKS